MFVSVPKGEVILMKWILHDWSDDHCQKLLKNCFNALPESGKVVLVEAVLPETAESDLLSKIGFQSDMSMMTINPGGKERTEREFKALAEGAGFPALKLACRSYTELGYRVVQELSSSQGQITSCMISPYRGWLDLPGIQKIFFHLLQLHFPLDR